MKQSKALKKRRRSKAIKKEMNKPKPVDPLFKRRKKKQSLSWERLANFKKKVAHQEYMRQLRKMTREKHIREFWYFDLVKYEEELKELMEKRGITQEIEQDKKKEEEERAELMWQMKQLTKELTE